MTSCRKADDRDLISVNTVFIGVLVQILNSSIAVPYLCGKNTIRTITVIDGSQGVTTVNKAFYGIIHIAHVCVFIIQHPGASMYPYHQGKVAFNVGWKINIQ